MNPITLYIIAKKDEKAEHRFLSDESTLKSLYTSDPKEAFTGSRNKIISVWSLRADADDHIIIECTTTYKTMAVGLTCIDQPTPRGTFPIEGKTH